MTTIEDLKDEVTILEVLGHYGASTGRGAYGAEWQSINCPFCKDRSGSASVSIARRRFLCHQCGSPRDGKSGDIIDIVMFAESLTNTKAAIEWIKRTLL